MVTKNKKIKISGLKSEEVYHPWVKKQYRKIGEVFARMLANTNVTPNQVTVCGFFISCLGAYFFFRADYASLIVAAILLQLGYVFDFIDGSLSRIKNAASDYGDWLDRLSGLYAWVLIFLGATLGVFRQTHEPHILIFGLLAAVGTLIKNYTQSVYLTQFKFASGFGQVKYKKLGFIMFLRPTAPFVYTIFTIGAIFNKMYWVLIFFGAYTPMYTVLQNIMFTLKAKKEYLKEKKS